MIDPEHGTVWKSPDGRLKRWDSEQREWIDFVREEHTEHCVHRGQPIGNQRTAGCQARKRVAMVFECAIHDKATLRSKVLIGNTRRPDMSVAICLGCKELRTNDGD